MYFVEWMCSSCCRRYDRCVAVVVDEVDVAVFHWTQLARSPSLQVLE